MDNIILHISDLHVSLDKKNKDEKISLDSFLRASKENEKSLHYIDIFITKVKEDFLTAKNIYLLVTGDITDCGAELEFKYALEYLNRIITELDIQPGKILIIPGDHDINRKDIENLIYAQENYSLDELNGAKFQNFSTFYNRLTQKEFDPNKVIFDTIEFEDNFTLVGLNSSYYVNLEDAEGKIDIEKFKQELLHLNDGRGLKKVICCHHNITSLYENRNSGQWDPDNRIGFIATLETDDVKFIFSGNEHTSGCKKTTGDSITISDAGAFSSKKYDCAFKIYELIDDKSDDIKLVNHIYALQKTGMNDGPYFWNTRDNSGARQPKEFVISMSNPPSLDESFVDLIEADTDQNKTLEPNDNISKRKTHSSEIEMYINPEISDALYKKVKELNLFHSGHFHWSETSRAHNWIDTSKLIESKDNLNFIKNAIIDVIEKKELMDKIHLIIGLGYEGNIISSKATIKFNKPYTFLPYSYRHDEHHAFENALNFKNDNSDFKNVLIITDVVNDGRTIRKLIKKRQNEFFKNVGKVYVISLFYTGESVLNQNILNYDFVKTIPNYDIENDEEVNNIEFYTVKSLKVEKCPYGNNFREECLIVKDGLGCVNLFYDESKYLKQT